MADLAALFLTECNIKVPAVILMIHSQQVTDNNYFFFFSVLSRAVRAIHQRSLFGYSE